MISYMIWFSVVVVINIYRIYEILKVIIWVLFVINKVLKRAKIKI